MKKFLNKGYQIHNFLSSYGSGSTSQKVTVPVPVPQRWFYVSGRSAVDDLNIICRHIHVVIVLYTIPNRFCK
jgi:hypothetical protein